MEEIIERAVDGINKFLDAIAKLVDKVAEFFGKIAKLLPEISSDEQIKSTISPKYKHYNQQCIKPNTKPYSAHMRIYRVQVK